MAKNIEIFSSVFVLGFGVLLGFLYSNYFGGGTSPSVNGALQLHSKDGFLDVPLTKRNKITHDTYILTFGLPAPDLTLGLETGQHIIIHANLAKKGEPSEEVKRKYTPVSRMNQTGSFDLLVKIYRAGANPNFVDGGLMTQYLETVKVGETIRISGPIGRLHYYGNGQVKITREDRKQKLSVKKIGLIAGGSGITPMYQIIQAILDNHQDPTHVYLLFGNRSEEDILLQKELEEATKDARIKVYFAVDQAKSSDWKGFKGYFTKEMIEEVMPEPKDDVLICHCGPRLMNEMVVKQLRELGYKEENIHKF
jgi:NAD(P)H-flavin reductase